jgi:hypothetical protein
VKVPPNISIHRFFPPAFVAATQANDHIKTCQATVAKATIEPLSMPKNGKGGQFKLLLRKKQRKKLRTAVSCLVFE